MTEDWKARAERAEASIKATVEHYEAILRDVEYPSEGMWRARAERAEARVETLRNQVDELDAEVELQCEINREFVGIHARAERAEALLQTTRGQLSEMEGNWHTSQKAFAKAVGLLRVTWFGPILSSDRGEVEVFLAQHAAPKEGGT